MLKLHPEILERGGKKQFVVLPYEEYEAIREVLQDFEDLRDLRQAQASEGRLPGIPMLEIQKRLRAKSKGAKSQAH